MSVKIGTAPELRDGQSLQDWCADIEAESIRTGGFIVEADVIRVLCVRIDEIEAKVAAAGGTRRR